MCINNWTYQGNNVVGKMIAMVFKKFSWCEMQRAMGKQKLGER